MKWYKHDSRTHADEKIRDLVYRFGQEGYGIYNTCLELIAEKIDNKLVPKIKISDRVLREICKVSHRNLTKILSFFDQNSLIFSFFDGEYWNLHCPNLLSRIDNWTRDLVATSKRPSNIEEEVRSKKKNKKLGASLPTQDFLTSLKSNEAYKGIDIDREFGKCKAWCVVNKKVLSQRRFVNWLNRVEKPIVHLSGAKHSHKPSEEKIKKWKAEAAPMPEECRKQLEGFGIKKAIKEGV